MSKLQRSKAGILLALLTAIGGLTASSHAGAILRPTPTAVAAGAYHSCVLWDNGGVSCWGSNYYGQLGNPAAGAKSSYMVGVTGLSATVKQVVAGDWFTCALLTTGGVQCWGNNGYGQLGTYPGAGTSVFTTPVAVPGFGSSHPITQLAAGGAHMCALDNAARVYCWGSNSDLQLGYSPNGWTAQPQSISLPGTPISISAGEESSCAVVAHSYFAEQNQMYCWGNLGGGTEYWADSNSVPQLIGNGPANFYPVSISAGADGVCAYGGYAFLSSKGGVTGCFGGNGYGQLGAGLNVSYDLSPVSPQANGTALPGINVLAVGPARSVNCANVPNKGLYCWGKNDYGQLGDYKTESYASTAQEIVYAPWSALSIAAGESHTCAVLTYPNYGNYVYCWGYNQDGEVGDGTYAERDWPVRIF